MDRTRPGSSAVGSSAVGPARGRLGLRAPAAPRGPWGPGLPDGSGGRAVARAAALGPAAARRAEVSGHDLARARGLFQGADRDADGALTPAEGRRVGLSRMDFVGFDTDEDGRVAADEFVVGYGALVGAAGRTLAADLLAEVTRLEARRRVLAAERAALERFAGGTARTADSDPRRDRASMGAGLPGGVGPTGSARVQALAPDGPALRRTVRGPRRPPLERP